MMNDFLKLIAKKSAAGAWRLKKTEDPKNPDLWLTRCNFEDGNRPNLHAVGILNPKWY